MKEIPLYPYVVLSYIIKHMAINSGVLLNQILLRLDRYRNDRDGKPWTKLLEEEHKVLNNDSIIEAIQLPTNTILVSGLKRTKLFEFV